LSRLEYSPRLWRDFVPVAFHVDYWNYLGWKDNWSQAKYSKRKRTYAQHWRSENIYTPEYVLNGKEWQNGFTDKSGPQTDGDKVGVLTVWTPASPGSSSTRNRRWRQCWHPNSAHSRQSAARSYSLLATTRTTITSDPFVAILRHQGHRTILSRSTAIVRSIA